MEWWHIFVTSKLTSENVFSNCQRTIPGWLTLFHILQNSEIQDGRNTILKTSAKPMYYSPVLFQSVNKICFKLIF